MISTKSFCQSVTRNDVDTLSRWMTGYFSSHEQSVKDTTYADIELRAVPMWPHRIDGRWVYAEHSLAASPEKPFRQTVYHLFTINDSTIVCQDYDLKFPQRSAGEWRSTKPLDDLRYDSLIIRQGCALMVRKSTDGFYYGSTPDRQCAYNANGAAYTTFDARFYPDKLLMWERGWDMFGKQLWGPPAAGCVFIRSLKD